VTQNISLNSLNFKLYERKLLNKLKGYKQYENNHLLYNIRRFQIRDTHFTGHIHNIVLADIKSSRSQPVPVQNRAHIPAVGEDEQSFLFK